jgi:methyl-accepting chemotaxis protein
MQSIRSKLLGGLGLIVLFFLAQAGLVWWSAESTKRDVVDVTRKNTLATSQLNEIAILAQQIRRYEKEYFVYVGNEERRNNYVKEWSGTYEKLNITLENVRANKENAFASADISQVSNWKSASDFYGAEMKKIFEAVSGIQNKIAATPAAPAAPAASATLAGKTSAPPAEAMPAMFSPSEANVLITAGKDRFSSVLIKGVSEMSSAKTKITLSLVNVADEGFRKLLTGVLATVLIGSIIAGLLMLRLPKAVTDPIAQLTQTVDEMTKGNLDQKITANVSEFGGLATALERMRVSQSALVQRMRAKSA